LNQDGIVSHTSTYDIRPSLWEQATPEQWHDWHWQQQNRVRTLEELEQVVELSADEREAFSASRGRFRVAITPHYASLMDPEDPNCPIRLQAVPQPGELVTEPFELEDPLAEDSHMPVPGITHRYPDRVLFYVTHNCPVYCRHCTRKRKVSDPTTAASRSQIKAGLDYIRQTPQVRDVLISGGDPLTLSDARLADIFGALRAIEHVEVIRLGTRNPVTLPQRITDGLCEVLAEARPIYLHTHFNHSRELGHDARLALQKLLDAGCVLGNQMVLLKGINDDPNTVLELNRQLLACGCRPYYILQCDMAQGITHFRTPLSTGLGIMDHLRGRIGGMGVPDFVVDLPGGGGKVELVPEYIVAREPVDGGQKVRFRNWAGETFEFIDVDRS
jgi:lysine 2,3-aminomutase